LIVLGVTLFAATAFAQRGGPVTFTFAHPGPIRTMDAPVTWFGSTHWLTNTLYDCLIWRSADGDGYVGQSAERWEAIDDVTWRFYLREGITFQNGEPLNADAVKWNIDRILSRPDFLVHPQWLFVKEVVVHDETTLDIITNEPQAYFEYDVSFNGCQILPPGYMAEVGEEEFARRPVGSGPYRLVEFTPNERYVFEAWDDYWGGRPEVDRIVYQVIPEMGSQIAALLAGQIDFVRSVPVPDRNRVSEWPDLDLLTGPAGVQHLLYAVYQTETGAVGRNYPDHVPVTKNKLIRQAVSRALDRELLADVQGNARPSLLRTDVAFPEHRGQWAGPQAAIDFYDPELAPQLIVQAGYDPAAGRRPVIHLDSMDFQQGNEKEIAEVMAALLEDVGFDVRLNILGLSAYQEQVFNSGNYRELALSVIGGAPSLIPLFFSCEWVTPRSRPCDVAEGEWDELNKRILSTIDLEQRLELWEQFWDFYVDEAVEITIHFMDQISAINNRFEWTPRADGWMTFRDLRLRR
jgi:peptide/nickel transport system substrate-binding protein